ncbi:MAG: hypothetical protein JSS27_18860 [Planctomycetes bacterium]|nr:hypothetical protein [Planctomycetota bacterium]
MELLRRICRAVRGGSIAGHAALLVALTLAMSAAPVACFAQSGGVTIPSYVDLSSMLTAFGSALGAVVSAAAVIGFGFLVVRYGWGWLKKLAH